jgi:2-keto-4-pentenoate hydratase/2-oxohepta-3-ene-1,7-dioic acid hydratase in catechol pathway
MRFARLGPVGAEIPTIIVDGVHLDLRPVLDGQDLGPAFFAGGGPGRLDAGFLEPLAGAGDLRVGSPIARPGKVVCIGLNYRDHAEETGAQIPAEPVVFMKDPGTVVGPFDPVLVPVGSTKTDWEVELGVVIGSRARYLVDPSQARAHVAGYVLSHDVSEREFQLERGGQWDKGKSCETFNPLGPELVTADEITDPQNLRLALSVNGVKRQDGSTADMVFGIDHVIWYLSQFMVLEPGDLINTGTPAGVALGLPGHPYLRAGDVVELEIEGLGRSRQTFEQALR